MTMQKKRMLQIGGTGLLCLLMFGAGFGSKIGCDALAAANAPTPEPRCDFADHISADAVQLRINEGIVEWYDGLHWNAVADTETMVNADPYVLALEGYRAFEDEWLAELAEATPSPAEGTVLPELPQTGQIVVPVRTPPPAAAVGGGGGGGSAPAAPAAPAAPPASDTGDGENMEWSDDYL